MTNPRKLAARMTYVRPVDHRDVLGGGTPGLGLTGNDVAAALSMGGAGKGETMMVMHKWVQDKSAQKPLFYEVYNKAIGLAADEEWKVPPGGEVIRHMCRVAILEVTDPHLCPSCNGRREILLRGQTLPVTCPACNGVGSRGWDDDDRSCMAGIDAKDWKKSWGRRYVKIRDIVDGFERRGLAALRIGIE